MQIFKKRGAAITVAVIVMVVSALFGVHRSVGRAAKKVEKMFYDGVYVSGEGYRQASIQDQLDQRLSAAMTLWSIASNYDELSGEAEELRASRAALADAESISEKYGANLALSQSCDRLTEKLASVSLNERDKNEADDCIYRLEAAQKLIDSSSYGDEVDGFINGTMKKFPVKYLKSLAFCKYPEYFAVNEGGKN